MLFNLRLIALVAAVSAAVSPLAVSAEDRGGDHDHDLARELYEHGQIRSLAEVLRAVRERSAGDVVGVVLRPVGADWVYRIQVVRVDGRRSTIDVDAETAVPIEPNGRQ